MELKQKSTSACIPLSLQWLKKKVEKMQIDIFFPDEIGVTFDSLYGLDQAKEAMQDIIRYFADDSSKSVKPHFSYCIFGETGVGKASLVYATSKAAGIPVIAIDFIVFLSLTGKKQAALVEIIYSTAKKLKNIFGGCSVVFKNIHAISEIENNSMFFASLVRNASGLENVFSFMLSVVSPLAVPAIVLENNLFNTAICIDEPDLATREKIFKDLIQKFEIKIADDVSISRLAKDTFGETPLEISYIIKEAHLFSLRHNHDAVTAEDFSETIMKLSAGEKKKKMTDKEKLSTAYHEAGHVIAGYFSNPNYQLSRVEISPRTSSLGLTATDIDERKFAYFKEDFENLILECLGGMAAEEVVYHSHTSGVIEDLSEATAIAVNMVRAYGMNDLIGPMQIAPEITDSEHFKAIADTQVSENLKKLLNKTIRIISEHRAYLDALAKTLVEKEVILGNEIEEIFAKVKHDLEEQENAKT